MTRILNSIGLWLIIILINASCVKQKTHYFEEIQFKIPEHFPEPIYNFTNNPITREGFELGRKLFFDKRLSLDNSVSCSSCHQPHLAFSDAGKVLSQGFGQALGDRNSPSLSNLAWYPAFMWDGGVNHIEISSFAAITHPAELNIDFAILLERLRAIPSYQLMFEKAFGSPGIDDQRFFYAITQFIGLLISSESKYDRVLQGKTQFEPKESLGKTLFDQHCASCHKGVLQTDFSYRNNGLSSEFSDAGRYRITNNPDDLGKFRVPSLRNVALTFPYMHDGRFSSLEEVLNHYTSGIQNSVTLDPILNTPISLDSNEREALIAFLHTLSDFNFTQNPKFKNPF
jgi:cytochrome c peroxidase